MMATTHGSDPHHPAAAARTGGDRDAFDRLFAQVYEDLQRMAQQQLQRHRRGETQSTTELAHEVYLRLVDRCC